MAKSIGDVRPSQVITSFGPGAIVDLQTLSIIVAGIDNWRVEEESAIYEPRLQTALGVSRFFPALPSDSKRNWRGTVPAHLFPRYQVCPQCQTLSQIGEGYAVYDPRFQEVLCTTPGCRGRGAHKRAATMPAPFIVACPSGHIDDFPWRRFLHGINDDCTKRMRLYSAARTGTVMDIMISCDCEKQMNVGSAFGEGGSAVLGSCTRSRPWLGKNAQEPSPCQHEAEVVAMQRGATNAWFPVVRSTLSIKEAATPIGQALLKCNPKQIEKITSLEKLATYIDDGMFPALEGHSVDEIWLTLQKQRGEVEVSETDLRWPEWLTLRDPATSNNENDELFLEAGKVPGRFFKKLSQVVLARKLLEVRALVGFTRIDSIGTTTDDSLSSSISPISAVPDVDWLPAVEVRGEGIFLELSEDAVSDWEKRPEVIARVTGMANKFREWEDERGAAPSVFPGARYVLLHSLAHALIRQVSLDCGYSSSSLRERIYSCTEHGRKMAGILIYTASPDSEGSLGGLVDLGDPQRFPEIFASALRTSMQCSSDPLCADHKPEVHATINAAACHACILASETSCETFNRFLDRNLLVPTMADSKCAFFDEPIQAGPGNG